MISSMTGLLPLPVAAAAARPQSNTIRAAKFAGRRDVSQLSASALRAGLRRIGADGNSLQRFNDLTEPAQFLTWARAPQYGPPGFQGGGIVLRLGISTCEGGRRLRLGLSVLGCVSAA